MQLALNRHPDLRAAAAEWASAQALTQQAGAWPNPEISAQVEDPRGVARTTTFQWSQSIEAAGKRSARVDAAQWVARQAQSDAEAREASVRARLSQAFYSAVAAQQRVTLSADQARWAAQARSTAARRVAAGKSPPLEEVKAQVAEVQTLSAHRTAQGEWRAAWQALVQAMGGDAQGAQRVKGDLNALPDVSHWQGAATRIDDTRAVQRAQFSLSHRESLVTMERTRSRPDLSVQLGIKRDAQAGRNQPVFGVALPIPLWDRNQGAITAALRQSERAEAELGATRAEILSRATTALEQLQSAVEQTHTLRNTALPAARQALDIASKGYELGKFGILDVLDAQRTLFEVQQQSISSAEQAFQAQGRLIELFGHAAPASLD